MAARHYAAVHPELGKQLYDTIDQLLQEIRHHPTLFRVIDFPLRRHFGRRFPYAVVFVDLPEEVWVVAVMHFKQRPEHWTERIT